MAAVFRSCNYGFIIHVPVEASNCTLMALQECPIKKTVINHMFATLAFFLYFLFTIFKFRVASELICNLVEKFPFLLEHMQLHSLGNHIIALLHDINICSGFGLK